jgi:hypothetical protein
MNAHAPPAILTDLSRQRREDPAWEQNEDARLSPEGIAQVHPPNSILVTSY